MAHWASFNQSKDIIPENRKYLQTMLKIALLCVHQDLALRGHDKSENSENKGNFKEILALLASENLTLKHQLENAPSKLMLNTFPKKSKMILKAAAAVVLHSICEDIRSGNIFHS